MKDVLLNVVRHEAGDPVEDGFPWQARGFCEVPVTEEVPGGRLYFAAWGPSEEEARAAWYERAKDVRLKL